MTTNADNAEDTTRPIILLKNKVEIEAAGERDAVWAALARLDLHTARFQGRTYRDLLMAGLDLKGAMLSDADFTGCDFTGALFSGVVGERTKFVEALFHGAEIDNSQFIEADFTGATLRDVGAKVAHAVGVVFEDATIDATEFDQSQFQGASFKRAAMKEALFAQCDFTGVTFEGAVLKNVRFRQSKLVHTNFVGATLHDCEIETTDLSSADFTRADLKGTKLNGCVFTGMTLKDAKNIPQDIDQCGSTKVVDVLVRRARALGNTSPYMGQAFSKLWFQHLSSGGDLMLEKFEDVMDAALAIADSIEGQNAHRNNY